jgi:hypothetical protein
MSALEDARQSAAGYLRLHGATSTVAPSGLPVLQAFATLAIAEELARLNDKLDELTHAPTGTAAWLRVWQRR